MGLNFRIILCDKNKSAPSYEYFIVSCEAKKYFDSMLQSIVEEVLAGQNFINILSLLFL